VRKKKVVASTIGEKVRPHNGANLKTTEGGKELATKLKKEIH